LTGKTIEKCLVRLEAGARPGRYLCTNIRGALPKGGLFFVPSKRLFCSFTNSLRDADAALLRKLANSGVGSRISDVDSPRAAPSSTHDLDSIYTTRTQQELHRLRPAAHRGDAGSANFDQAHRLHDGDEL